MFLTVTTLKDPSKMHSGHHTCEFFAFVGYEAFEKWAHTRYGARPADYEAMKEDLAWRMVRGLEKAHPRPEQAHRVLQPRHTADQRTLSQRHAR